MRSKEEYNAYMKAYMQRKRDNMNYEEWRSFRDKNNYIMTAKDGANCKKLVTWLRKVSASDQASDDMVKMFTTAAWQISDKWLKANFTISNIYSQANNIYTKFMYSNPAAQQKRRQEEIERLVNEYEG
jgi:hypothetical protein